jgi:predicted ABC-type ATPase
VTEPYLVILAGPNGVGKTTFARANLVEFIRSDAFLNADELARNMRPDDVAAVAVGAGRRLIDEGQARLAAGPSFCIETTLATRVMAGGHNVDTATIHRGQRKGLHGLLVTQGEGR